MAPVCNQRRRSTFRDTPAWSSNSACRQNCRIDQPAEITTVSPPSAASSNPCAATGNKGSRCLPARTPQSLAWSRKCIQVASRRRSTRQSARPAPQSCLASIAEAASLFASLIPLDTAEQSIPLQHETNAAAGAPGQLPPNRHSPRQGPRRGSQNG